MLSEPRNPVEKEICDLENQFMKLGQKISELREGLPPEKVENHQLMDLKALCRTSKIVVLLF